MSARELKWFMGYNSLGMIIDQERKHWLMKTDKKKQLLDPVTGDQYMGQVDNMGSDIVIEAEKQATIYSNYYNIKFDGNLHYIMQTEPSAFTYNCTVNGLAFARVLSTNYPLKLNAEEIDSELEYHNLQEWLNAEVTSKYHYRLTFEECETVIIPFGGSSSSNDVFATKWIKTNKLYIELMDGQDGAYSTKIEVGLSTGTNPVFYYPLDETMQTIPIEYDGDRVYHTLAFTDDRLIGYPAFWFTCDETNQFGPRINCDAKSSANQYQLFGFGNAGNETKYMAHVYVDIDGINNAVPDDTQTTDQVTITVYPETGYSFYHQWMTSIPIKNEIKIGEETYSFDFNGDHTKLYLSNTKDEWVIQDGAEVGDHAICLMSEYDDNCLSNGHNPLIPIFNVMFDNTIPLMNESTTDTGAAGIRIAAGNIYSDMYQKYPYDFNLWNGLPAYMENMTKDNVPEHMAIYAFHDSKAYMQSMPEARQTAALLFDLGQLPDHEKKFDYVIRNKIELYEWPSDADVDIPFWVYRYLGTYGARSDTSTNTYEYYAQKWMSESSRFHEIEDQLHGFWIGNGTPEDPLVIQHSDYDNYYLRWASWYGKLTGIKVKLMQKIELVDDDGHVVRDEEGNRKYEWYWEREYDNDLNLYPVIMLGKTDRQMTYGLYDPNNRTFEELNIKDIAVTTRARYDVPLGDFSYVNQNGTTYDEYDYPIFQPLEEFTVTKNGVSTTYRGTNNDIPVKTTSNIVYGTYDTKTNEFKQIDVATIGDAGPMRFDVDFDSLSRKMTASAQYPTCTYHIMQPVELFELTGGTQYSGSSSEHAVRSKKETCYGLWNKVTHKFVPFELENIRDVGIPSYHIDLGTFSKTIEDEDDRTRIVEYEYDVLQPLSLLKLIDNTQIIGNNNIYPVRTTGRLSYGLYNKSTGVYTKLDKDSVTNVGTKLNTIDLGHGFSQEEMTVTNNSAILGQRPRTVTMYKYPVIQPLNSITISKENTQTGEMEEITYTISNNVYPVVTNFEIMYGKYNVSTKQFTWINNLDIKRIGPDRDDVDISMFATRVDKTIDMTYQYYMMQPLSSLTVEELDETTGEMVETVYSNNPNTCPVCAISETTYGLWNIVSKEFTHVKNSTVHLVYPDKFNILLGFEEYPTGSSYVEYKYLDYQYYVLQPLEHLTTVSYDKNGNRIETVYEGTDGHTIPVRSVGVTDYGLLNVVNFNYTHFDAIDNTNTLYRYDVNLDSFSPTIRTRTIDYGYYFMQPIEYIITKTVDEETDEAIETTYDGSDGRIPVRSIRDQVSYGIYNIKTKEFVNIPIRNLKRTDYHVRHDIDLGDFSIAMELDADATTDPFRYFMFEVIKEIELTDGTIYSADKNMNTGYDFIFGDPDELMKKYSKKGENQYWYDDSDNSGCYPFYGDGEHRDHYEILTRYDYPFAVYTLFAKALNNLQAFLAEHDKRYISALGILIKQRGDVEDLKKQPIVEMIETSGDGRTICRGYVESGIWFDENNQINGASLLDWGKDDIIDFENEKTWIVTPKSSAGLGADGSAPDEGWAFQLTIIEEINNVGRVYILSNDEAVYENNETTAFPKPARTAARICDIPTSIVQLTGISGVSPASVVDPKYIRSEASFSAEDKDRLYNDILASRWVRPIHLRLYGHENTSGNDYVFTSVEDLESIDLISQNDFRKKLNLNPKVDPKTVSAGMIVDGGRGYKVGDYGLVYVGGFAFQYNVLEVNNLGGVTKFSISPIKSGDKNKTFPNISLSNFELSSTIAGITETYGTSPVKGHGRGFKCSLYLGNPEQYLMEYGDVFTDLFALVKLSTGLWIYTYNGKWNAYMNIAEFESFDPNLPYQTPSDAFMASIMSRRTQMKCCRYVNCEELTSLDMLATPSFVNVVDNDHTPVQIDVPIANEMKYVERRTVVDFCKFRCEGIKEYIASTKTQDGVVQCLSENGEIEAECYIAYKWDDERDASNKKFYAGIIKRSFNNIVQYNNTPGSQSILPVNHLRWQKNVHSNPNTTIVWDVPNVGPMMWIFNPSYEIHEKYHIDTERRSFYIERTTLSWDDIDIYNEDDPNQPISLFKDDILDYTILTNSPYKGGSQFHVHDPEIYAQPQFYEIEKRLKLKKNLSSRPTGNWECIFPRVHGLLFKTVNDRNVATRYIPIQMHAIHTNDVKRLSPIINPETGWDESARTIIFEDTSKGVRLRVFNGETKQWDIL